MLATLDQVRSEGFEGFVTVRQLRTNPDLAPDSRGVYLVLMPDGFISDFVERGTGGRFKGRDPNRPIDLLRTHWIDGTAVLNIGQAGGNGSSATLRKRLRQYMRFGAGEAVGHWGGRHIWQLADSDDLIICWKVTEGDPRVVEREMIAEFTARHGRRPFANLVS